MAGQQRRQESGRVHQLDAVVAQQHRRCPRSARRCCGPSAASARPRSVMSGTISANSLTCLTCPAITAWVTPAAFSRLMHLPSCPSETQCSAAAGGRAASSARSGNASSLIAMTVTSCPAPRAASRTRNGNRPFPRSRPSFRLLLVRQDLFGPAGRASQNHTALRGPDEVDRGTALPRRRAIGPAGSAGARAWCSASTAGGSETTASASRRPRARSRAASARSCSCRRSAPAGCRPSARKAAHPW